MVGGAGQGPAAALEVDAIVVGVRPGLAAEARTLARVLREQDAPREGGEQVVVAVASPLSWALTPARGDGAPLSAADEGRRRAAPGAQAALEAERVLLRAARPGVVRSYAVTSGVPYGHGETDEGFAALFRGAWESGRALFPGDGRNVVPTIHVRDLAEYIAGVVAAPPARQGVLLAADGGSDTLMNIASAVGASFHGAPVHPPSAEALEEELMAEAPPSHRGLDLAVNLRFNTTPLDPAPKQNFSAGLVAHVSDACAEYLEAHNLAPLKILVVAPPASGGAGIAASLARQYSLPLVRREEALAEREGDALSSEVRERIAAQLGEDGAGQLEAADLAVLYRAAVAKALRSNKGYVLDSFPDSLEVARAVFAAEEGGETLEGEGDGSESATGEVAEEPTSEGAAGDEGESAPEAGSDAEETVSAGGDRATQATFPTPTLDYFPGAVVLCHCEPDALESRTESIEESMDVFRKKVEEYNEHRKADIEDATERLRKAREEQKRLQEEEAERRKAEREASGAAEGDGDGGGEEAQEASGDGEEEEEVGKAADGGLCAFLKERGGVVLEGDTTKTSVADVTSKIVAALGPAHNFVGLMPSSPRAHASKKSRGQGSEIPPLSHFEPVGGQTPEGTPQAAPETRRAPGSEVDPANAPGGTLLTAPTEGYLMGQVMPAVTEGLIELCQRRPEEPVAYLGRFLLSARKGGDDAPAPA